MPVNIDPEIRRQILEEEVAAGRILIAEGQHKIGAGALVGRGCTLIQQVDSGQAPLSQLGVGMEYVLQGVEQMMAVTGFEPQLSGDGFHPQREGSVYKKLKGSWEILEPVFTQQGKVPRWAEPLAAYMTGRYKKAAATRQSNQDLKASWSEKKEAEVRKAEEEKIRARTMEEWTNNFVRRLEQERRGSSRDEE